jgi:hypothetical protein
MPSESRPPSIYNLVWGGRYYQLWQRPEPATTRIIEHVPLGESNKLPYCGAAQAGTTLPLCSANPVAVPPCSLVERLGRRALRDHAELVAYQRPQPVVVRGDQVLWPAPWIHGTNERTLTPTTSGQAVAHIEVTSTQRYELFLGGAFSRGFDVSVDGGHVARVKDELSNIGGYAPVGKIFLTGGVHSFVLSYPHSDLTPGSGDTAFTGLSAIALQPLEVPSTGILRVPPQQAKTLCGQPLDWVEIILPGA